MLWSKQAVSEVPQALVQLIAPSRKFFFHSTEEPDWDLIVTLWSRLRQQLHGWSTPTFPEHTALQIASHGRWPHSSLHATLPAGDPCRGEETRDLGFVLVLQR